MRASILLALLCAALLTGCGTAATSKIAVNDPWVRAATMTGAQAQPTASADMASMQQGGSMQGGSMQSGSMQGGSMGSMQAAGGNSAAYMTIVNSGGADDRLTSASSDVAQTVELHESKMVDNVMQMAPVNGGIPVPANGQAELKQGGLHVMLIGLTRDLAEGETVRLTLTFERAGTITVDAPVRMP